MNLKNYLTPAQVKAYATTPKKALAISKKHWWQNTQLTQKQLETILIKDEVTGGDQCGLCHYYNSCKGCPLGKKDKCSSGYSIFSLADSAAFEFWCHPTKANYKAFIEASKNMHKCLCELEKK